MGNPSNNLDLFAQVLYDTLSCEGAFRLLVTEKLNMYIPVGIKLKYWREEKRFLSINQLSQATGVKTDTISDIERGRRQARRSTLEKLLAPAGLNLSFDDLANMEVPEAYFRKPHAA
jgi:hypothetical protein